MDMLTLQCNHALQSALAAIEGKVPVTSVHGNITRLFSLLNIERNNGKMDRRAATLLLSQLDTARVRLRRLWVQPTELELEHQIQLLEAAMAPVKAYLDGPGRWPECRSESMEAEGRRLTAALKHRYRQVEARAVSLQAI